MTSLEEDYIEQVSRLEKNLNQLRTKMSKKILQTRLGDLREMVSLISFFLCIQNLPEKKICRKFNQFLIWRWQQICQIFQQLLHCLWLEKSWDTKSIKVARRVTMTKVSTAILGPYLLIACFYLLNLASFLLIGEFLYVLFLQLLFGVCVRKSIFVLEIC